MKEYTVQQKIILLQRLENISPQWAKHLSTHDGYTSIAHPAPHLHIVNNSCCIVGEAHGFNNDYVHHTSKQCPTCIGFNIGVMRLVYSYRGNANRKERYETAWKCLKRFIEHFEIVHKKLIPFKESIIPEIISK